VRADIICRRTQVPEHNVQQSDATYAARIRDDEAVSPFIPMAIQREDCKDMRVILFGAPGSGKGTQAQLLNAEFGVPHISTGDVLRSEIADGSILGQQVARYVRTGQLVPDDLVTDVMLEQLHRPAAADGFVLDGYPRTVGQATALTADLAATGTHVDAVVALQLDSQTVVTRMLGRGRADDSESVIRDRLEVFHKQTLPLFAYYGPTMVSIDASGDVQDVYSRLRAALRCG
jgi:adenylate kinase